MKEDLNNSIKILMKRKKDAVDFLRRYSKIYSTLLFDA